MGQLLLKQEQGAISSLSLFLHLISPLLALITQCQWTHLIVESKTARYSN